MTAWIGNALDRLAAWLPGLLDETEPRPGDPGPIDTPDDLPPTWFLT